MSEQNFPNGKTEIFKKAWRGFTGNRWTDEVNVREFPLTRVTGYRWPLNEPLPVGDLPVGTPAQLSMGEA